MKKSIKLFILVNNTKVLLNKDLPSIIDLLPEQKDISEHIRTQLGQKEFRPIIIEVYEDKLTSINLELRRKTCTSIGYKKITIYIESISSNKVLPIIQIVEK